MFTNDLGSTDCGYRFSVLCHLCLASNNDERFAPDLSFDG
jgi:hypothetical protein